MFNIVQVIRESDVAFPLVLKETAQSEYDWFCIQPFDLTGSGLDEGDK